MDFRKILFFCLAIFFANRISAQLDSISFSFSSVADPNNSELHELTLDFEYSVVSVFTQITIELIVINSELEGEQVYSTNFEIDQLDGSQYFSDGSVTIPLATGITGYSYSAIIRLFDSLGHQIVINENLAL